MKLKILLPLIVLLIALVPTGAFALHPPSNNNLLIDAYEFDDAITTGDVLYIGRYDVQYSTATIPRHPTNEVDSVLEILPIGDVFSGEIVDIVTDSSGQITSSSSLGSATIKGLDQHPNHGYGGGLWALYFETKPVVTPVRNACMVPQPTPPDGIPAGTQKCVASFTTLISTTDLQNRLIEIFQELEVEWNVIEKQQTTNECSGTNNCIDLIAAATDNVRRFTPTGEAYIVEVIPLIREMVPDMFTTTVTNPTTLNESYDIDTADMNNYFAGTTLDKDPGSGSALVVLSNKTGIPVIIFGTTIVMLVAMAIAWASIMATGRSEIGMFVAIIVMSFGGFTGLVSFAVVAIMAMVGALALGYVFFYKSSTS